jgi:multisubunit Na+/H+ antiporter MnhE subunit
MQRSNLEQEPRQTPAVHLIRLVFLFGLYLLLAESLKWPELLMGAGAAAVAVFALGALSRHNDVHFRFDARWLGAMLSAPREIAADSLLVLGNLFPMLLRPRPSFGHFQRRRSEQVPRAELPAWRAFKVADISLAPNTYVVDVQKQRRGRLLIHQLADRAAAKHPQVP